MNYPTFLKKVDALTSRCDADSLRLFVHELARTIQEKNRERFLQTLEDFCDAVESDSTRISKDDTLERRVDELLRALSGIQNGDRELEAEYNERWDDWSDEEEEEYEFSDPDHLFFFAFAFWHTAGRPDARRFGPSMKPVIQLKENGNKSRWPR